LVRGFAAKDAVFGGENEFWPDLLKDSFNCRDLGHTKVCPRAHGVELVIAHGEWPENGGPAVALSGAGRYIDGSKISTNRINFGDSGWLASSSILCRV
jgi:hypothetical protein